MTTEELAKLTPEEKRIRIAEACGATWFVWIDSYTSVGFGRDNAGEVKQWREVGGKFLAFHKHAHCDFWNDSDYPNAALDEEWRQFIPDYLSDFNAIRAAVIDLPDTVRASYACNLRLVTLGRETIAEQMTAEQEFQLLNATAAQRADAFLLTISRNAEKPPGKVALSERTPNRSGKRFMG